MLQVLEEIPSPKSFNFPLGDRRYGNRVQRSALAGISCGTNTWDSVSMRDLLHMALMMLSAGDSLCICRCFATSNTWLHSETNVVTFKGRQLQLV